MDLFNDSIPRNTSDAEDQVDELDSSPLAPRSSVPPNFPGLAFGELMALFPVSQEGGGRRARSIPPELTPTKLRSHITPTNKDHGVISKALVHRAYLAAKTPEPPAPRSSRARKPRKQPLPPSNMTSPPKTLPPFPPTKPPGQLRPHVQLHSSMRSQTPEEEFRDDDNRQLVGDEVLMAYMEEGRFGDAFGDTGDTQSLESIPPPTDPKQKGCEGPKMFTAPEGPETVVIPEGPKTVVVPEGHKTVVVPEGRKTVTPLFLTGPGTSGEGLNTGDVEPQLPIDPPTPAIIRPQSPHVHFQIASSPVSTPEDSDNRKTPGRTSNASKKAIQDGFRDIENLFVELSSQTDVDVSVLVNHWIKSNAGRAYQRANRWNQYGSYFRVNQIEELRRVFGPNGMAGVDGTHLFFFLSIDQLTHSLKARRHHRLVFAPSATSLSRRHTLTPGRKYFTLTSKQS